MVKVFQLVKEPATSPIRLQIQVKPCKYDLNPKASTATFKFTAYLLSLKDR